jgi:hypothetical protein
MGSQAWSAERLGDELIRLGTGALRPQAYFEEVSARLHRAAPSQANCWQTLDPQKRLLSSEAPAELIASGVYSPEATSRACSRRPGSRRADNSSPGSSSSTTCRRSRRPPRSPPTGHSENATERSRPGRQCVSPSLPRPVAASSPKREASSTRSSARRTLWSSSIANIHGRAVKTPAMHKSVHVGAVRDRCGRPPGRGGARGGGRRAAATAGGHTPPRRVLGACRFPPRSLDAEVEQPNR